MNFQIPNKSSNLGRRIEQINLSRILPKSE